MKAKREVRNLTAFLTSYVRDFLNPKRKIYGPEFDLLRSGKNEICRMLMFSNDDTPELLMKFGLAFVRNNDPEAFSSLATLVERVQTYGEPKGRFRRFLGRMEKYPQSYTFLTSLMIVMVTIVLPLILYYILGGYHLPTT